MNVRVLRFRVEGLNIRVLGSVSLTQPLTQKSPNRKRKTLTLKRPYTPSKL